MNNFDASKIKRIGIDDNGCSNKVIYTIECNDLMQYNILFNTPSGYLKNSETFLVGDTLESADYNYYKEYDNISINFKARPSMATKESIKEMEDYLKEWHFKTIRKWNSYKNDNDAENTTLWIAGCPNGWDNEDIEIYRQMYNNAGYKNVIIFPEGHAAVLSNALRGNENKTPIEISDILSNSLRICIDCGGYSNEATFISASGVKTISTSYVGAHIIDIMIICANIYMDDFINKFDMDKYEEVSLPRKEVRNYIKNQFETDPKFRAFLFLQGRWIKEACLKTKSNYYKTIITLDKEITLIDGNTTCTYTLYVNEHMINRLIDSYPVKEILTDKIFNTLSAETQEEIGDENSWIDCFANFIDKIAQEQGNSKPEIILTGGASQIPLVETTVRTRFIETENEIKCDKTPTVSVAKGLCAFGAEKLRSLIFDHNCNRTSPEASSVKQAYKLVCSSLTENIKTICRDAVIDAKNNWLNGSFWSNNINNCQEIISGHECSATSTITNFFAGEFDNKINESLKTISEPRLKEHIYNSIIKNKGVILRMVLDNLNPIKEFFSDYDTKLPLFRRRRKEWMDNSSHRNDLWELLNCYEEKVKNKFYELLKSQSDKLVKHYLDVDTMNYRGNKSKSLWITALENPPKKQNAHTDAIIINGVLIKWCNKNAQHVTVPGDVTTIGKGAFANCPNIKSVTIEEGVKYIEAEAFRGCTGVTSITVPNTVIYIGAYAFAECTNLTSIDISRGIVTIEHHTFHRCTNLKEIIRPYTILYIGAYAFAECPNLTKFDIPGKTSHIGSHAFCKDGKIATITIDRNVTYIGADAINKGTTVFVYDNSYAHKYAKQNQITYAIIAKESYDDEDRFAYWDRDI